MADQTAAASPSEGHMGGPKDAMGQDKRRQVVGHSYGPSKAKQALYYGGAVAVIAALFIGGKFAADELDKPPETNPDKAPWAQPDSPQTPPVRFQ